MDLVISDTCKQRTRERECSINRDYYYIIILQTPQSEHDTHIYIFALQIQVLLKHDLASNGYMAGDGALVNSRVGGKVLFLIQDFY